MSPGAEASEPFDSLAPWGQLLARHRTAWSEGLLEPWSVVDLAAENDPVTALTEASDRTAFVWLEGFVEAGEGERLRQSLEEAGRRNVPIVVGFENDAEGEGHRKAEELLAMLDGGRIITQELAAGSLIGPPDPMDEPASRRRSVHVFVCANLDADELEQSSSEVDRRAQPLMTGYVGWLAQANRELRAANARLGRERLGVQDASAAAVEDRRVSLEERVSQLEQQLEEERQLAQLNHDTLVRTLDAPRYRAVDRLRELAFKLPGVSLLLGLRSRQLQGRWGPED